MMASMSCKFWIAYSVWATAAGWTLSLLGRLNAVGYGFAVLALALALAVGLRRMDWRRLSRRPHIPALLPCAFLAVAAAAAVGACLYEPANYDFHSYRLPRMLMWLHAGRWHWIMGADWRMNSAGTAQEWLLMPLLAWGVPLRLAFLPSLVSFLLLPGLLFRLFLQLGVFRRIAWQAMWLVPMASMFVLQAGAATNDLLGTTYALAAFVLAFDHRRSPARSTFFWCLAAAALMTSVKPTNIPLLLPLAVLLLPSAGQLAARPLSTLGTILVAAGLSFLPIMIGNTVHHGTPLYASSAAAPTEGAVGMVEHTLQVAGDLIEGLFALPVNPLAPQVESLFAATSGTPVLGRLLSSPMLGVSEILMEEECGPGIALTVWVLWVLACTRRKGSSELTAGVPLMGFGVAALVSSVAFAAIVNSPTNQRLFMPYYPILLGALLATRRTVPPGHLERRQTRWPQTLVLLSALASLVMTPARPLWPALSVGRILRVHAPSSKGVRRMNDVYAVYRARPDALAAVREGLRDDDRVIAFFGIGDDLTTSLWRPLGTRRVVWLSREALRDGAATRDLLGTCDVLVANETVLRRHVGDVPAWCRSLGYHVESIMEARMKVSDDRTAWCIVRRDGAAMPPSARTGGTP